MILDKLITHGFSVASIANAYKLDLHELRRLLTNPPERLCQACIDELRYTHKDETRQQLARRYNCSTLEINRVLYSSTLLSSSPPLDLIQLYCIDGRSASSIALEYKIPLSKAELQWPHKSTLEDRTLALLRKGLTKTAIAKLLKCPIATVYTYASKHGYTTTQRHLTADEWDRLLNEQDTVSALSRKYSISRAAIYKRKHVLEDLATELDKLDKLIAEASAVANKLECK